MSKFGKPLDGVLKITYTYHTVAGNTSIDISARADDPVYALIDGVLGKSDPTKGSYVTQSIDGSDLKIFYVHTYKWLPEGTRIKKGDVIARIAPTSLNGGYPTHLHVGLPAGHYIMDYFDRSLPFTATHPDILKTPWFKSDKTLNWDYFQDLHIGNAEPVQPVIDPCKEALASANTRIAELNDVNGRLQTDLEATNAINNNLMLQLQNMNTSNASLERQVEELTKGWKKAEATIVEMRLEIEDLRSENLEHSFKVLELTAKREELSKVNRSLEAVIEELRADCNTLDNKLTTENKILSDTIIKKNNEIGKLRKRVESLEQVKTISDLFVELLRKIFKRSE